jgi:hypothetical protein
MRRAVDHMEVALTACGMCHVFATRRQLMPITSLSVEVAQPSNGAMQNQRPDLSAPNFCRSLQVPTLLKNGVGSMFNYLSHSGNAEAKRGNVVTSTSAALLLELAT